jgi:hypothetical protein
VSAILESFRTQMGTWLIALLIAILGLFSSWFTERIKFGLNRADLRTTQYEELASEVSQHVFFADLLSEFLEKGWTTRPTMTDLLKDYNASIITLRKKEFVYTSWIHKFWGQEQVNSFNKFMTLVREFDTELHSLNNEFEAVNITGTQNKVDEKAAAKATKEMQPTLEKLRAQGHALLMSLG